MNSRSVCLVALLVAAVAHSCSGGYFPDLTDTAGRMWKDPRGRGLQTSDRVSFVANLFTDSFKRMRWSVAVWYPDLRADGKWVAGTRGGFAASLNRCDQNIPPDLCVLCGGATAFPADFIEPAQADPATPELYHSAYMAVFFHPIKEEVVTDRDIFKAYMQAVVVAFNEACTLEKPVDLSKAARCLIDICTNRVENVNQKSIRLISPRAILLVENSVKHYTSLEHGGLLTEKVWTVADRHPKVWLSASTLIMMPVLQP